MEWIDSIVGALGGGLLAIVSSIFYFKPKLKEARAEASKAETEASSAEYAHLLERIKTMEEMYEKQGHTIDELREKVLELGKEKLERDLKIVQLEKDNQLLTKKVDELTKEVEAYRVIAKK